MIPLKSFFRTFGAERSLNRAILLGKTGTRVGLLDAPSIVQKTTKRHSGHNAMEIVPSNYQWLHFKNTVHFWFMIGFVPFSVIATIINIRANPELTEIPEGYEPRHWEYFKHPVSRWMAKYLYLPPELENEMLMHLAELESETNIMRKIRGDVHKIMQFYNDHRSNFFKPYFAEHIRKGRDDTMYNVNARKTVDSTHLDIAHEAHSPIPAPDGFRPED